MRNATHSLIYSRAVWLNQEWIAIRISLLLKEVTDFFQKGNGTLM